MVHRPDASGLCADGSQPQAQGQAPENVSGAAGSVTTESNNWFVVMGRSPDVTTGLCADGSQPQAQGQAPENVSGAAGSVTTEEQLVCSDGTSPDTTGLCADGSQPQAARTSSRERKWCCW